MMGFTDRLRTAMLYVIGGEKAIIGLPFGSDGASVTEYSQTDFDRLSKEGYEKNAVIYACVNELASSASEANVVVEQRVRDGWEERPEGAPGAFAEAALGQSQPGDVGLRVAVRADHARQHCREYVLREGAQ